ncbi:hypothetical protein M140OLGA_2247 [Staphylococcus aureus subsp. aureus 112808A]|nr:hypothetical protein M140OLGA_2247 [Staphylococcus aureus subsp. aureus 112808A]
MIDSIYTYKWFKVTYALSLLDRIVDLQ